MVAACSAKNYSGFTVKRIPIAHNHSIGSKTLIKLVKGFLLHLQFMFCL